MAAHSRSDSFTTGTSMADTGPAGLHFTCDLDFGIRRRRSGKGFRYVDQDGAPIRDAETLARIKALAIPPAWTDVWICSLTRGHLQATGRDARGRKQYRYHNSWRSHRDQVKYGHLVSFAHALPKIRTQVEHDLRRHGLPREKVIATMVALLEQTLIRVGNDEYARSNQSYGLTTLLIRHVKVGNASLRFRFVGKSGKEHRISLRDRRLARIVGRCQDIPGQRLFVYEDDAGITHPVGSADINSWLAEATGAQITAKDFRTWSGTVRAASILRQLPPPETEAAANHEIIAAVDAVAALLGNTRTVARSSYIHPAVLDAYRDGTLQAIKPGRGRVEQPGALDDDERVVLRLLKQLTA